MIDHVDEIIPGESAWYKNAQEILFSSVICKDCNAWDIAN